MHGSFTQTTRNMQRAFRPPSFRFKDVHLPRIDHPHPLLRGASFTIAPGKFGVLTSTSAADQYGCALLFSGARNPEQGALRVGDTNISVLPASDRERLIHWIPQHPRFPAATIREIIAPDGGTPVAMVIEAATRTGIHYEITALPLGYDSPIHETTLPAPLHQRILLARASLAGTPVIVVDELGDELDVQARDLLLASLRSLRDRHTLLLLARHHASVRAADHVVLLEGGRVFEEGNPAGLLDWGDRYADAVRNGGWLL